MKTEERFRTDFPVVLAWADSAGGRQSLSARCMDLSASGMRIETRDPLQVRLLTVVQSGHFGRMGHATVRYCRREGMKYSVGLQFSVAFGLGDPVRKQILEKVLSNF